MDKYYKRSENAVVTGRKVDSNDFRIRDKY